MALPVQRKGHTWADACVVALAKIFMKFDAGSNTLRAFAEEHGIVAANTKYDQFNATGASKTRDSFINMIHKPSVEEYRRSLQGFNVLTREVLRSARKHRPHAQRFHPAVTEMESLEDPPGELFKIHDQQFPLSETELIKVVKKCREIYNTTRHIDDIFHENKGRHIRTWDVFFKDILPMEFTDIMSIFEKMLKVLEFIETGKTNVVDEVYLRTQLRKHTEDPLYFAKPEILKSALGANKWGHYVEVEHKPEYEGEDEETLAIQHLDYLTRPQGTDHVLEINGEGGLGKTKLAREYILRSIDRNLKYRPEPYEYYLYYTAKSEQQGEVTAAIGRDFTESPDDWAVGGGDYIHKLSFDQFIEVACRTFDLPTADAKENLLNFLKERRILLLLDNFEDVENDDIAKYRKFFRSIHAGTKSRILITSRKDPTYGRAYIELSRFDRQKAVEMLHHRYLFEIQNNRTEYRMKLLNELREIRESNRDVLEEIITGVVIPEDYGAGVEALERNLTHPLYLRLIANILANPSVVESSKSDSTLVSMVIGIIDNPEHGFWEWHDNVVQWMLKHAYNKVEHNVYCIQLLELLQKQPNGVDKGQIHALFRTLFPEEKQLMTQIESALKELNDYGGFLEDFHDNNWYVLSNNARKFLLDRSGLVKPDNKLKRLQNKDEAPEVDFVAELSNYKSKGIHNWTDVEQVIAIIQHYLKTTPAYDKPFIAEIEEMCFAYVNKDSPGIDDVGVFLELLRIMKQGDLRAKLVVRNSSTLADDEVFNSIGDDVQFLSSVLMNDAQQSAHMIQKTANSTHAGATLMLVMKMLDHGVQGDVHLMFDLMNAILDIQSEESIGELIEHYDWGDEFGAFIVRRVAQINWSLKTQNLFDLHTSEQMIDSITKTSRFSFIKPEDVQPSWTVQVHPDGEQTFDKPGMKGFTVQWDLLTSTIVVYVLPQRVKQLQPAVTKPVADQQGFVEWTRGNRRNQPGLSVDPVTMASDISITTELYNESTFDAPVGFSRAEKFKKLYKQIYKGPISAQSMAFILAIRLDNTVSVSPEDLGEQLVIEYERRLKKYDDDVEKNEFYSRSEIELWKNRFSSVVRDSIELLNADDQRVGDEIERRKSSKSAIVRPQTGIAIQNLIEGRKKKQKHVLSRKDAKIPPAVDRVLKAIQNRPLLRRTSFRNLIIKHGGSLHQTLKDEQNASRAGVLKDWQLHDKWIDSATSVVWNLTEQQNKRFDYSAELIEKIEHYHFNRWSGD